MGDDFCPLRGTWRSHGHGAAADGREGAEDEKRGRGGAQGPTQAAVWAVRARGTSATSCCETATAASSNPPGLSRMSRMSDCICERRARDETLGEGGGHAGRRPKQQLMTSQLLTSQLRTSGGGHSAPMADGGWRVPAGLRAAAAARERRSVWRRPCRASAHGARGGDVRRAPAPSPCTRLQAPPLRGI
eukprot:6477300-Prymnesium_polylepis.1